MAVACPGKQSAVARIRQKHKRFARLMYVCDALMALKRKTFRPSWQRATVNQIPNSGSHNLEDEKCLRPELAPSIGRKSPLRGASLKVE
jgi:hypothetical protein